MIGRMVILHGEGRGYCRNWGGAALDVLAEVLLLQTHHAMEKPEPYCRRYLAFKPEETESILRGADDLATSTLNTAHSCMHVQSMFLIFRPFQIEVLLQGTDRPEFFTLGVKNENHMI